MKKTETECNNDVSENSLILFPSNSLYLATSINHNLTNKS